MASARSRMEPFAERTVHATRIIPFPTRIMSAPRRQYTTAFLAGSFGLSEAQATSILDEAGEDRTKAADMARLLKVARR